MKFGGLGLIANLLLVFIVAIIVGWPFEKRIRNGNFFQYSLFSIGVLVTLLCIGLTFAVGAYRDFLAEQSYVSNLEQLQNEDLLVYDTVYTDRFPRVISQFINGGYQPWKDQQISRTASDGWIMINVDEEHDDERRARVLTVLDQGNFSLSVRLVEYNERAEKYLEQLDAHKIMSLDLDYDVEYWLDERLGEEFYDMTREEALRKAKIAVNLDLKLPHIRDLTIELNSYFTAKAQLEPFLDLPSEAKVVVDGVTDDAAKYLLETEKRWPALSNFNWSEDGDLGAELSEKMLQRFPHPQNGSFGGGAF